MGMDKEEKKLLPNGGYPMHTFEDVKGLFFPYITSKKGRKLIEDAYLLATEKHSGVFRKSGEAYIQHPIEVAYILAQLQCGPETIAAGFLHDTVEDTDLTIEDIKKRFGEDTGMLVDYVTKIQRMKLSHKDEADFEAEDHRKIFIGMAKDVRVILIKLADRLHNMRTLDSLKPERQIALSEETLNVFAPIAHRLGIYKVQSELEDLCLKHLKPEIYSNILRLLNEKEANRAESLTALKKRIADILFQRKLPFRIESRIKSIYSIYRKMYEKHYNFDEIYDVLAIRIITESELNCYEILGIIHSLYRPVPGRFKDYIAMPKPNMYQSLHTTIISGDGNIYEIQIRTEEMDVIAESGIAAHWKYKEGDYDAKKEQEDIEDKLSWFRDFVFLSSDSQDAKAKDYLANLSQDIFNANVYVFTPMGKVIELPQGATVIDFAYKIHTKVGDTAVGATVNGSGVTLGSVLKTGDVCEIRTAKNAPGPNDSWLAIAKTSSARNHIKRFLNEKNAALTREDNIASGKRYISDFFKDNGIEEAEMEKLISQDNVLKEFGVDNIENLYININSRNPIPSAVFDFLGLKRIPKNNHPQIKNIPSSSNPITFDGGENVKVSLAKCCHPIPGDDIVGYITKGSGVQVHRTTCPNISNAGARLIDVHWRDDLISQKYPVELRIYANDRPNLVADVLNALATKDIAYNDLRAKLNNQTMSTIISLTAYVTDTNTLEAAFNDIRGVKGVYQIERHMN